VALEVDQHPHDEEPGFKVQACQLWCNTEPGRVYTLLRPSALAANVAFWLLQLLSIHREKKWRWKLISIRVTISLVSCPRLLPARPKVCTRHVRELLRFPQRAPRYETRTMRRDSPVKNAALVGDSSASK